MGGSAVNRWAVSLLCMAAVAGCHLGRPGPTYSYHLGHVEVPEVEPGLSDALSRSVSAALSARSALGGGVALDVRILEAVESVIAVDGAGARVHRVGLVLRLEAAGPAPRSLVVRGERGYAVSSADPTAAEAARSAAFAALTVELSEDAVTWLVTGPSGGAAAVRGGARAEEPGRSHDGDSGSDDPR
jgi:hypothetical protein